MATLHVVMPVYNEPVTLAAAVARVLAAPMPAGWQLRATLIDDGSDAATKAAIADIAARLPVTALAHAKNRGKGAAIRTGFAHVLTHAADDDAILIQDADLEYDPADFQALLVPLVAGEADLVLGNRWATPPKGLKRLAHRLANGFLTLASNITTGLKVHDMECCFKLFTVPAMRRVIGDLDEERFGIEPQIVASAARHGLRVREVPVSYAPRSFEEGKKIRMKDGFRVFVVLWRERGRTKRLARAVHSRA
ncbi:MAG: glycosyltransferase family 2 protein [bacterium]|jgi:glycosyltransferase involved in cell wall biosynthesis